MKFLILSILLIGSIASAGISIDEKFLLPNVNYVAAGTTIYTASLLGKNMLTRTENGVSSFYLSSFTVEGFYTTISATAAKLGLCSLQIPIGTTIASFFLSNPTTSQVDRVVVTPRFPIVITTSFALSCQPVQSTSTQWGVTYTGWEY